MMERPIYSVEGENRAFMSAVAAAQATFRFFYRELSWEQRRIVPGLDLAAVKISFAVESADPATPSVENMWVTDIGFDGQTLSGVLMNDPHWVASLSVGDTVAVPFSDLNDWMYVCAGRVYGGFTIDALRSGMSAEERMAHDGAWGLDFGEPGRIELVMPQADEERVLFTPGLDSEADLAALSRLERTEHPMSVNVLDHIEEDLAKTPALVAQVDEAGWQFIHHEALAGNHDFVSALLRHGADPQAANSNGHTPLMLARMAGWPRIVELLEHSGAQRGIPLWPVGLAMLAIALGGLYYLTVPSLQMAWSGLRAAVAGPMPFVLCFLLLGMGLVSCTGAWYFRLRLRTPRWGKSRALDVVSVVGGVVLGLFFQHQFAEYLRSLSL